MQKRTIANTAAIAFVLMASSACTVVPPPPLAETLSTSPPAPPPPPPPPVIEQQIAPAGPAPAPNGEPQNPGDAISVTPMTLFSDFTPAENQFVGAYTRLVVTSNVSPGGTGANGDHFQKYETRDPITRFFWGLHSSLNLSANIKLSGGASPYNAAVTLLSMDHVSDSTNGEQFTRIVTHRAESFPLFLVGKDGTNSIVSVKFDLKASETPTGSAAATALAVAQKSISLVAPQAAVLTTLSATATQNAATALDQAINQLFTKSVEEEPAGDRDIRAWTPGHGIGIYLEIPDEGHWTDSPIHPIGSWTVTFDDPQPSIFDNVKICAANDNISGLASATCFGTFADAAIKAQSDANSASVLNYSLTNGGNALGTVSAYLAQQASFTAAVAALGSTPNAASVEKLCSAINNAMITIGLNDVDAGIVTVAARKMSQVPSSAATLMAQASTTGCGFAYPASQDPVPAVAAPHSKPKVPKAKQK